MISPGPVLCQASATIEQWLGDNDRLPIEALLSAIDRGGAALLSSGEAEASEAERYRVNLGKVARHIDVYQSKLRRRRYLLDKESEALDNAQLWARNARDFG